MRARIVMQPDGVEIYAPFRQAFVDDIKAEIPREFRAWDASAKCWTVSRGFADLATEIAGRYFEIDIAGRGRARQSAAAHDCLSEVRSRHADHATLYVLPDAPAVVILGAYRALAREHHPDRVGSAGHDAMVKLNAAFERLKS
jgi:hypothetical protein